jgi:hypothetical protein
MILVIFAAELPETICLLQTTRTIPDEVDRNRAILSRIGEDGSTSDHWISLTWAMVAGCDLAHSDAAPDPSIGGVPIDGRACRRRAMPWRGRRQRL